MLSSGLVPTGGHFLDATGFGLGAGFEAGPPFSNFDIRSLILVDEVLLLNIPPPSSSSGELRFSKLGGSGEIVLSGDVGRSDLNEGVGLTGRKGGGSSFFISATVVSRMACVTVQESAGIWVEALEKLVWAGEKAGRWRGIPLVEAWEGDWLERGPL